ncbi:MULTISPECIES: phosphoribosylaminoimidazolecarboxamide formyltransferase [Paenibacillus]|uniref:5-aminoimidazole-4-carboxamide ribonucleotide transformylase n=1 Tax=Paenibacillus naphthalenovorans TaxID=162209 RepID=A0A0U2WJ54_9BACL|nr:MULTISPECIES: phosphoribosylaminoimidazolecarboxamide formyltransferase [Paenibacillus]ALS25322.1 5-aminoimidazole-4-carboxamide ribonucleotide transformylase [Paenibacillus naphthalenovorans]GCL74749.1 5-aminoimidazole-4-carboxamide ribonucleotide formyltransferase [Paenibacillus naphthalenovorans]SDJ64033.1 phosphoribosylaminoimidazolecarboxamide formyltransferase / IMP cyclohydrolase [Paenibacillus naphthalenovorans]
MSQTTSSKNVLNLRYGMNPHQKQAKLISEGALPVKVLNGDPGFINLLDALNGFQLARELRRATGLPAAASFKHVSPAGAAVAAPLSPELKKAYFVEGLELSPLATAYARARGADRMSSFGDAAALSDIVDASTAQLLKREVSDLVVAPGYTDEALEILKAKKNGGYLILQIDPDYVPNPIETRTLFGLTLQQERNDAVIDESALEKIVTKNKELPEHAKRDLLVALVTLKYTQSNSICYTLDGQTIGIGAGQQSRIHCTRLAGDKADRWFLRQHPTALNMKFRQGLSRAEQNNAIDLWLEEELTSVEQAAWEACFEEVPARLSREEKREWLNKLQGVSYGSDAFLPFRDNLDRASRSGVKYVVQAGSSMRDEEVVQAANDYGMVMMYSGVRLFHH